MASRSILEMLDILERHLSDASQATDLIACKGHLANARVAASSLRGAIDRPTGEFPPLSRDEAVPEVIAWPDEKTERAALEGEKK